MVVTTQSSGNGRWAFQALGGMGVIFLIAAACAGGDTPPRTTTLEAEIIERYDPGFATGNVGGSSAAGTGGGGQGGSSSSGGGAGGGSSGSGSVVAGAGGGSAGSGSGSAGSGSGGGDVCNAPVEVFQPSCGALGSACHGAGSGLGDFGDTEEAALALFDEASNCGGLPYFDSADPENSAVVVKLSDSPPCGSPMPIGPALSQDEIDCVVDWIAAQN